MPRTGSSRTFKQCKQRPRLDRLSYRENLRQIFFQYTIHAFHHITEPFDSVARSGLDWHRQSHFIQFNRSKCLSRSRRRISARARCVTFLIQNSRKAHQLLIIALQKIHKIRITLSSRKVASLEKVCQELIERAKSKSLTVKGPGQSHYRQPKF